jgi:hypothetical protein
MQQMVPSKVFRTDYTLREFLEKYFDHGGGRGAGLRLLILLLQINNITTIFAHWMAGKYELVAHIIRGRIFVALKMKIRVPTALLQNTV